MKKPTVWKANMQLGLIWLSGNAQSIGVSGSALVGVKHWNNQLEFSGGDWPPLAEVNEAMRQSREHLNSLGLE